MAKISTYQCDVCRIHVPRIFEIRPTHFLHLKAEIAKLEEHVQILKRRIAELEKEKEKVREIMGGK